LVFNQETLHQSSQVRRLSENREPTTEKPFWPDFPFIFVKERNYSPQMKEKSDSKWLSLATVSILRQPPRQSIKTKKWLSPCLFSLLIYFLSSLHYTSYCYAELRDPTRPAFYSAKTESEHNQIDDLNLSSIWISGHNKRVTINGVTARQGEHIFTDIKIVQILNDSVVIEQNGMSRKLYLLTRSYKTR